MTRALVLGGGGPVGIAWETGLVVGLARHGIALVDADLIVGTSAGSAVGAQMAIGLDLEERAATTYAARPERAEAPASDGPTVSAAAIGDATGPMAGLMAAMEESAAHPGTPEEARAILGRFALEQETMPEDTFVGFFSELSGAAFPHGYACTAVHAETGEFVVWDAASNVDLQRAVASSCSVPGVFPPITIDGARYIDGGMRSPLNADVAAGHDLVVVVSCMATSLPGVDDPRLERMRAQRDAEEAAIAGRGGRVHRIDPGSEFLEVSGYGMFLMDGSRGPDASAAGLAQADDEAHRLFEAWNG